MANQQMGLIGRKMGMTQIYENDGTVHAVTVLEAGPNVVLQIKTSDGPDGYDALQLGFGEQKPQRITKAQAGHFAKTESPPKRLVKEIRLPRESMGSYEPGQTLDAKDVFAAGDRVDVIGVSKGCGFGGVMKKYNFAGFIRSHGSHEFFRHGGSIGTRLTPGHVFKGQKMPGHMGAEQVSVQNLQVVRVDAERSLVFIKGGVPGPTGAFVTVRKAVKHRNR